MPVRVEGAAHIWDRHAPLVELALGGGSEPALRIAPECSTSQPQMHADCDGCDCRCHPDPARPVVAPYLPTAAAPEGINDVHLPEPAPASR